MKFKFTLLALILFTLSIAFGAVKVSNREPQPGEWGYRPVENQIVLLNPPSLCWVVEQGASTYIVQWSQREDLSDATTVSNVVWNTYTHNKPLKPGKYYWRYCFRTKSGELSQWSKIRSFVIPETATEFPMPTIEERKAIMPKGHPRLFLRPEDLPRLRQYIAKNDVSFSKLKASADKIIADGPTPEPEHLGSANDKNNKELVKYWWPNREQTLKACNEAEVLAFVYLITQDKKYGEAARKWMMHLMSWDPDGPTNFRLNCEAAKPMLHRPARVYDWAYDMFTQEDREKIWKVMRRRVDDAWKSGEVALGIGHLNRPYNSHGNRTWHKIAEAGIAFSGELPEADIWLDYAINKFYACYPVWSDDDGGWHEGLSYWGGYMSKAVWWLQFAKSALNIDGLKKPFFSQVGDFALYIAPPGSPNMGFGDLSYGRPSQSWGGFMEYFIRAGGSGVATRSAPYWRWWTEQWKMRQEGGILGFLYEANLPLMPPAKAPVDIPQSKVFHGIGIASLHNTLLNSDDDVHLLFKSSPFGSQSHGHNPQNSFQLNAFGDELLTTCVYRDLHGSKFHYGWAHSSVAHNTVLVNRQGQIKHTQLPYGRIVYEKLSPDYDYVVGDAALAYGGALEKFLRHIVFIKPDVIVIYDEISAKELSTFQFMLHSLSPFEINEKDYTLQVKRKKAGVTVRYLSDKSLSFRQWDGYEPPPDRPFPDQWHVEAGTQDKSKDIEVLTVIVPYKIGNEKEWQASKVEGNGACGIRFKRGNETILVGLKRAGSSQKATIDGIVFDGNVIVKKIAPGN